MASSGALLRLPFLPIATFGFVLFGALLVLVGASQDELQAALRLDLTRTGLLGSSVVLGIGLGVLAGGPLVDRLPRRPLLCGAALLTAGALCAIGLSHGFAGVAGLLGVAGVGGGLYETILNSVAIERYQERSVRIVSTMHAGATVGAMLTPLAIGAVLAATSATDWTLAFRTVGLLHAGLALLALAIPLGAPRRAGPDESAARPPAVVTASLVWLCIAAFAYIGVESALTIFAIPYAEGLGLEAESGRRAISLFWMGLLAGRLALALRSGIDDARFATAAGGIAGAALVAGVALGWARVELLLAFVGLALGGVFPLLVVLAGRRTPQATGTGVAVVAGLGSAGGFVLPWLTGLVGDAAGVAAAVGTLGLWCGVVAAGGLLAEVGRDRLRG